jgi:hypothetical protein
MHKERPTHKETATATAHRKGHSELIVHLGMGVDLSPKSVGIHASALALSLLPEKAPAQEKSTKIVRK